MQYQVNERNMEVKIVVVYFLLAISSIFADEVVKIGKSIYTKERIVEYDEEYESVSEWIIFQFVYTVICTIKCWLNTGEENRSQQCR